MKNRFVYLAIASVLALSLVGDASAQSKKKKKAAPRRTVSRAVKPSGAETGLVGVKLYDTGMRLLNMYGNPDAIEVVGKGGGSSGPVGGGGGSKASSSGERRGSSPITDTTNSISQFRDFGLGDEIALLQGGKAQRMAGMASGGETPPPAAGGGGGGGAAMGGGGGSGGAPSYTRWVYERGPSRYGFILDKYSRIVQIEAVGMGDRKVRTRRGVSFGNTFAQIMKIYGLYDAIEINGDSLVLRYLAKHKVAFRLNRLQTNKPHVVTGVVVAAGKA